MSPDFKRALAVLSALLVLELVWLWFNHTFEYVTQRVHVGYRGDARENPYLAAERLFARLGLEAASIDDLHGLGGLPDVDGTLFVPFARSAFSASRTDELLGWVRRGGHLVVVGGDSDRDDLLEQLGVQVAGVEEDEDEDEESCVASHAAGDEPAVPIPVPDRTEPLLVSGTRFEWSELVSAREPLWSAPGHLAPRAVQLAEGDGLVTVLGASYFIANAYLGDHDNAEMAYRLATWGGRAGEVWLVYGYDVPSLLVIIWRRGWMVLASLLLLGVLYLLRRGQRFGPVYPLPEPARRGLLEHVQASGRFLWRHGEGAALLREVRAAVLARAALRISDWRGLDPTAQGQRIAERSGLSAAEVADALRGAGVASGAQLVSTMQRLERILNTL